MKMQLAVCHQILVARTKSDTTAEEKAETARLIHAFNAGNLEPLLETITLKEVKREVPSDGPAAENSGNPTGGCQPGDTDSPQGSAGGCPAGEGPAPEDDS